MQDFCRVKYIIRRKNLKDESDRDANMKAERCATLSENCWCRKQRGIFLLSELCFFFQLPASYSKYPDQNYYRCYNCLEFLLNRMTQWMGHISVYRKHLRAMLTFQSKPEFPWTLTSLLWPILLLREWAQLTLRHLKCRLHKTN